MLSPPFSWQKILKGILIGLLFPVLGVAQTPAQWLEAARNAYSSDQLDTAVFYYQKVYQTPNADNQLEALSGLIKVALLQSDIPKADSLMQVGDQIAKQPDVGLAALCKYKTTRGEFFRKNSKFQEALEQHQEVITLSQELTEDPLIYAYAKYYTALTFERLSMYDSSLVYVDEAYQVFKQQIDTTDLKFSGIYNGLGVCYYRANRLEEAKAFYLKSKAIAEEKLGPVSIDLAICLGNLSSISRSEENYQEAIGYSEQALQIYRALKDEGGMSSAYYSLGVYHYFLGDYGRTKDYMIACITIREDLYSPTHYSLIGPYQVLGIALEEAGQYELTLAYLKRVLRIIKANYSEGSLEEGYNYENTALCYQSIGKLDSALHFMQRSNEVLLNRLPENDYGLAVHYFNYGNIQNQLGQSIQGFAMLQQSDQIYEALGMATSSEYALNQTVQGQILAKKGKWAEGQAKFEQALDIIRIPTAEGSRELPFQMIPNTLTVLNEYLDFSYQRYVATQDPESLTLFETYSQYYLELSDRFRQQFIDPYTKSILIKDNAEVYDRNIGIYHQLYRQTGQQAYLQAAYRFSEYGRTCLLRDMLDEKVSSFAGLPDSVLQKEQILRQAVTDAQQQLLDNPQEADAQQQLFQQKEALNRYIDQTSKAYPRYFDLKFSTTVPTLSAVQAKLTKGENLVEFMQDDTAFYALVLNANAYEFIQLASRIQIETAISNWKNAIIGRDPEGHITTGRLLLQLLWQPLTKLLDGSKVTVIPVGPLFHLNFETLPTTSIPGKYLIQDYNITYALSFTVLFSEGHAVQKGSILAVAPGFEDHIKTQYQSQLDSLEVLDEHYLRTVRQPWSVRLAKQIGQQFDDHTFIGAQATESNIKAAIREGNVLYFGTHAIADPSDPLRSKLVLAKEMGEQQEDGYLHAYELYGLPLAADLAVLSACESGLGNIQRGEGMISLAYSIHFAGCPSTVMSLWKVDEKVNTMITADFLRYLNEGFSKSEALRKAKLTFLETADPMLQHPFYWGGMVLMGKDGTVALPSRWHWYYWVGGILGVLALLLLGRLIIRR